MPLVRAGEGLNNPKLKAGLGDLAGLVGNWNSAPGTAATGYNVMPVPAANVKPAGYLLKDFAYFEQMTFSALPGTAPNRGATFQQDAYVLFYAQRVYFAEGPAENGLVHAENGSWLHMVYDSQPVGAYAPPFLPPPTKVQPPATAYVKQVSVPHGNDILATGSSEHYDGPPTDFPTADNTVLPFSDTTLHVEDPNTVLQKEIDALAARRISVASTVELNMSSSNSGGSVTNIEFEDRHADVTKFSTVFNVQTLSDGTKQLQYSQSIWMDLLVNGAKAQFVHIDANTLVPAP